MSTTMPRRNFTVTMRDGVKTNFSADGIEFPDPDVDRLWTFSDSSRPGWRTTVNMDHVQMLTGEDA